jgi:hypothetical protein
MFFRREKPKVLAFADRLELARQAGFQVETGAAGRAQVVRDRCAALVEDAGALPRIGQEGVLIGGEIGLLVDGGFQKFFKTPGGKMMPALAEDLKALHAFDEDLMEALGLPSLYNQSLGTTCEYHHYDRVEGRE